MGRPKNPNSRRSKAEKRRAERAALAAAGLGVRTEPNERGIARREMFAFLRKSANPTPEGRQGSIDQDIHDGIGQLHALGFLDGHGHDPKDLRDIGRDFADLYWERYGATAPATGQFERRSKSSGDPPPKTARDLRFDRLDNAIPRTSMERTAIHMLLTHHYHSDRLEGWVQRLINRKLAEKGVPDVVAFLCPETEGHDRAMLRYAIRGLLALMDAGLPARFERRAA